MDDRQLTRFKNEARAAATLHHPNIVPVFSVGSDKGVHYFAMQLIDGPSLAEVIAALRIANVESNDQPRGTKSPPGGCGSRGAATNESRNLSEVHESSGASPIDGQTFSSPMQTSTSHPRKAPRAALDETRKEIQAEFSTLREETKSQFFRQAAEWIAQAATGLTHAHERGVSSSRR